MKSVRLKSSDLAIGDVVLAHGMRVQLMSLKPYLGGFDYSPQHHHSPANGFRSFAGKVINLEWAREHLAGFMFPDVLRTGDWTIQGNDFAFWDVERPATATVSP